MLTLFCLLFSNSLIDISRSIHDYFSVPSGELVWALSRTLDLVITGVLISIIMVTPFSSSTLLKRNLKETPTRFLKVSLFHCFFLSLSTSLTYNFCKGKSTGFTRRRKQHVRLPDICVDGSYNVSS